MDSVVVRDARPDDAAAIAEIYNQGIADRGATFETDLRTRDDVGGWFGEGERFAFLVVERDGEILGWARLSRYRPRACYAVIAEFSIYLARAARGQGCGRRLLDALIGRAETSGFHKLVARIFPFNRASRALCRACGFREVGIYEAHAQLDGVWLDVVIVERLLNAGNPSARPSL